MYTPASGLPEAQMCSSCPLVASKDVSRFEVIGVDAPSVALDGHDVVVAPTAVLPQHLSAGGHLDLARAERVVEHVDGLHHTLDERRFIATTRRERREEHDGDQTAECGANTG